MSTLMAELWCDAPSTLDVQGVLDEVRRTYADAEPLPGRREDSIVIAFPSLAYRLSDGVVCPMVAIAGPHARSATERPRDFSQTWTWPEATTTLAS